MIVQVSSKRVAWQVSWFVLGTITLNGTDITVKRLDRNVKTFSADSLAIFANICKQTVSAIFKMIVTKANQLSCHSFTGDRYICY